MYYFYVLPILFIDWILLLVAKYFGYKLMEKITFIILIACFVGFIFLYLHYYKIWIF